MLHLGHLLHHDSECWDRTNAVPGQHMER